MSRPLRIELAGGVYHVTSRGDRQEDIFEDDDDRVEWLSLLGCVCGRFNWRIHAYCLMDNHYHFVVETAEGNLSKGMRQLNGVYTQYFNRQHSRAGHVFQGRFKAILVEKEAYLLELSRYVVLNPIRAKMVKNIEDWKWSNYLAFCGLQNKQEWLEADWILGQFSKYRAVAIKHYRNFVREGVGLPPIWSNLQKQIYLGTDQFVGAMLEEVKKQSVSLNDVPRLQTRAIGKPLAEYAKEYSDRNVAIREAFTSGDFTMKEIGDYFDLHYTSISRIVNQGT
jgi:REP element-mobilizing transposase RayT